MFRKRVKIQKRIRTNLNARVLHMTPGPFRAGKNTLKYISD